MLKNLRVSLIGILIVGAFLVLVQTALAAGNSGTVKPGWGFGDTNHVHLGPPGSVHPVNQSNNSNVSNNISFSANTGGNNSGGGSVVTGAVSLVINVVNNVGQNILSWL